MYNLEKKKKKNKKLAERKKKRRNKNLEIFVADSRYAVNRRIRYYLL